jgi:hypothetical protein
LQGNRRQVLQRTKPLPNKLLGELIELLSRFSAEEELLPLKVDRWDVIAENQQDEWVNLARQSLAENLEGRSEDFQQYIWGNMGSQENTIVENPNSRVSIDSLYTITRGAIERYEHFADLRERFYALLDLVHFAAGLEESLSYRINIPLPKGNITSFPPDRIVLDFDEDDQLQFAVDEFSKALEGVDVYRIRKCEICKKVFWAGRLDKKCCSKKCNNVFNVRRSRERREVDPGAYKEKRKHNEAIRKMLDKNKYERLRRERLGKLKR